jgi:hypothetical protein
MNEKLEKLKKIVSKVELAEVLALETALETCEAVYKESPTAANGKNRDYARESLGRAVERLSRKYFPDEKVFKNRLEAHKHLRAEGYKIGRAKFYKDCPVRGEGMIRINADGTVPAAELEKYIFKAELVKKDDASKVIEKDYQRKARAEAEHKETRVEISKLDLEERRGNLIAREEVKSLFVDRIVEFQRALLSQGRRISLRCAEKSAEEIQKVIEADNWAILEAYARENPITGNIGDETLRVLNGKEKN